MAAQWFCKIMGDERGPMTTAQLQEVARSGRLSIDDLVRRADDSRWVRAENVVGLYNQPSLPVVVRESIAVIDDPVVRATWEATTSVSGAHDTKCSIEINASTLTRCNLSSTTAGGTTNQERRDAASRASNVIVPRRTLKMSVSERAEAMTRNFANRTTRAMNFDSQADTLPCAEAVREEDQSKTVRNLPKLPIQEDRTIERESAEHCVEFA